MRYFSKNRVELYVLEFPNTKRYFGLSINAERRWKDHKKVAREGRRLPVYDAIRAFGPETIAIKILAVGSPKYIADLEVKLIEIHQTRDRRFGYNVALGGDLGLMLTPEIRAKLVGRAFSAEHLGKLKAFAKARGMPYATWQKGCASRKGRPLSVAHKAKLSRQRKDRPKSLAFRTKIAALTWVTDGVASRRVPNDFSLPDGWRFGRPEHPGQFRRQA
jgi:hypothetical protein